MDRCRLDRAQSVVRRTDDPPERVIVRLGGVALVPLPHVIDVQAVLPLRPEQKRCRQPDAVIMAVAELRSGG
eukprot:COSAG04_NODE_6220_length_1381_cov_0.790172_2_plen_72_part_00